MSNLVSRSIFDFGLTAITNLHGRVGTRHVKVWKTDEDVCDSRDLAEYGWDTDLSGYSRDLLALVSGC